MFKRIVSDKLHYLILAKDKDMSTFNMIHESVPDLEWSWPLIVVLEFETVVLEEQN